MPDSWAAPEENSNLILWMLQALAQFYPDESHSDFERSEACVSLAPSSRIDERTPGMKVIGAIFSG